MTTKFNQLDASVLDASVENEELQSHENNVLEANNKTASDDGEVKVDLENRNNEIAIDPQRLASIANKLNRIRVGREEDINDRIKLIVCMMKTIIQGLHWFDDKSPDHLIGLVNFTFKGDDSVFTNNILPDREEYVALTHVINGDICYLLGGARSRRPEALDIQALDLEDRVYLFAKSLKELLSDNEWKQQSGTNLSTQEFERVQISIDEGVEYVANPNAYRIFMSYFQSPPFQRFIAPALNQILNQINDGINYARENPGNAAFNALAIGTSIAWGVQEGAPVDFQLFDDDFLDHFAVWYANSFIFAGLTQSGASFADEVRQALSGNNPLGRRMVQLGAIALGVYLANQNNKESIGVAEAFSMMGAAMTGISAVAALDNFANRARPLVNSRITQFSELVSNSLGNLFPANNLQPVEAQQFNQQPNNIEREV